jgi:hypothetical protein
MHSKYDFKFVAGSNETSRFKFHADHVEGSLEICSGLPDRSRMNPHAKFDWQREFVERVNTIYRFYHPTLAFTTEFVDAFNDWRQAEYLEWVAQIQAMPERYGTWADIEAMCPPPAMLRGVVWQDGRFVELERKQVALTEGASDVYAR